MIERELPPPAVTFMLDTLEVKQLFRKLFGHTWLLLSPIALSMVGIGLTLEEYRLGRYFSDPAEVKAFHELGIGTFTVQALGICMSLALLVALSRQRRQLRRPVHVAFEATRIEVRYGGNERSTRATPLAAVTSIRLVAGTFLMVMSGRWRRLVVAMPLRAMPNDGREVIAYLKDSTTAGVAVF